jgi:hypothetical protein
VGNGSVLTTYKCELGTVNSGGTVAVTITVRGDVAAMYTIDAEVVGLNTDASAANDEASTSFTVNPEPQESKGGGGGGSLDLAAADAVGRRPRLAKMRTSLFSGKQECPR